MLLVTGATGYIGSALVARLHAAGRPVRALVRDDALAARVLPRDVEVAVADLRDRDAVRRAATGCAAVLHLAATVGGSPAEIHAANIDGARSVIDAATAAGAHRLVLTSSGAALLDATGLVAERPVAPPVLTDPYSRSKAVAARMAFDAPGIDAVVVHPGAVYGPSPRGPQSYTALMRDAAAGRIPAVVDSRVSWVLVDDVADAHVLALDAGEPGRSYVAHGETARFSTVLHAFADAVGGARAAVLPPGSTLGPDAGTFARRSEVYGRFPPVRVDDAGMRALGFAPRGVAEGVATTAAWCATLD